MTGITALPWPAPAGGELHHFMAERGSLDDAGQGSVAGDMRLTAAE